MPVSLFKEIADYYKLENKCAALYSCFSVRQYGVSRKERPMPEPAAHLQPDLTTRRGQPLIGVPTGEGADEVVRYFTSEEEADKALSQDKTNIQLALSAI